MQEKTNISKKTLFLVEAGIIAAVYVAMTYFSSFLGMAYGPIQFRISEVLNILPVFTPAAIPGLTIGCILGNIGSPMGIVDILLGSLATLLSAVTTYWFRNIKVKNFPILSSFMPVIFNAIIIGAEITFFANEANKGKLFFINAGQIALSEFVMCVVGGFFFYFAILKLNIFKKSE
ncbi:MAG: QueT transporter family protein [Clostridia bacterium]|nr:QueT transporter family protein [Clostridia bacterium]